MDVNWRLKALIIGGVVGALTGLGAAYVVIQRADEEPPEIGATDGVKIGLILLGLLRQVGEIGGQKRIELESSDGKDKS